MNAGRTLEEKEQRVSTRWWKLAEDLLSIRDHVLRECWDGGTLSKSHSHIGEDMVMKSWHNFNQRRGRVSAMYNKGHGLCRPSLHHLAIHPQSWKRMLWILVGFAFMGFDIFRLTMDQFDVLSARTKEVAELAASVYWTLDIGVSFITGVFVNSQLIVRLWTIAERYVKTWFLFDAAMVALQWTTQPEDAADIVRYLRMARYCRLLRFAKIDQHMKSILDRTNSVSAILVVRTLQYLVSIVIWIHVSGCAFYAVGVSREDGWVHHHEELEHWPVNYLVAVHWASCNLQGPTEVGPGLLANERAFAVSHVLISVIVLALFVSKLTNVMATMEDIIAKMSRQAGAAQRYCKQHHISTDVSVRVRKWLEWHQILDAKRQLSPEDEEFMQVLPTDLRRALIFESRQPILMQSEVLHACHECNGRFFARLACDSITPVTHVPEETIFSYGMVCSRMHFIAAGDSTYLKYGAVLRGFMQNAVHRGPVAGNDVKDYYKKSHSQGLQEGMSLCESVLWIRWAHVGDFVAVTRLSLLTLEAQRFEDLVATYLNVQVSLQHHARSFIAGFKAAVDPSDLFNTTVALQLAQAQNEQSHSC